MCSQALPSLRFLTVLIPRRHILCCRAHTLLQSPVCMGRTRAEPPARGCWLRHGINPGTPAWPFPRVSGASCGSSPPLSSSILRIPLGHPCLGAAWWDVAWSSSWLGPCSSWVSSCPWLPPAPFLFVAVPGRVSRDTMCPGGVRGHAQPPQPRPLALGGVPTRRADGG